VIDRSTLRIGDRIRVQLYSSDPGSIRIATIVDMSLHSASLSLIDEPYDNGTSQSHNQVWLDTKSSLKAKELGLADDGRARSWYINDLCIVLEVLNRSAIVVSSEAPCQICQRTNDLVVRICYWCGEAPFGKRAS
jgi:hypothetical protein